MPAILLLPVSPPGAAPVTSAPDAPIAHTGRLMPSNTAPSDEASRAAPRASRAQLHRPGRGCPCGCTVDADTNESVQPWNPPAGAYTLGPLFFG
jgi:hypothetical protein